MHMCWGSNITSTILGVQSLPLQFYVRTELVHRCPHLHEFQSSLQISDRRNWKLPMAIAGERWREGRFTVDRSHQIKCKSKAGFQSMAKGQGLLPHVEGGLFYRESHPYQFYVRTDLVRKCPHSHNCLSSLHIYNQRIWKMSATIIERIPTIGWLMWKVVYNELKPQTHMYVQASGFGSLAKL